MGNCWFIGASLLNRGNFHSLQPHRSLTCCWLPRASLEYALHGGLVDAMTIGHVSQAQFDDTVANIEAVLKATPSAKAG